MLSRLDSDLLPVDALPPIADLESDERPEVLLHCFMGVLNNLDLTAARNMRDELLNRFGGRYCRDDLCAMMVDLLNGHLAGRQEQIRA
jgi:hypothetical protein